MAQFRLTRKFADDVKIKDLQAPELVTPILDDWFIDTMRVQRKKVAVATHGKSLLTFLFPYEQIGGAKSVPDCIPVLLAEFFHVNDMQINRKTLNSIFRSTNVFCKTNQRTITGHMNDFKKCIDIKVRYDEVDFYEIQWDELMNSINTIPLTKKEGMSPTELAKDIFSSKYRGI